MPSPFAFGVELMGGQIDVLVRPNTIVPTETRMTYKATDAGRQGVLVDLVEVNDLRKCGTPSSQTPPT